MKKISWNENVFNICIIIYVIYVLVYFKAYPGHNVNESMVPVEKVVKVLFSIAPIVNFACQVVALFQKRWKGVLFIVVGLIAFLFAIGFTKGQSV